MENNIISIKLEETTTGVDTATTIHGVNSEDTAHETE